jgi:hypothetical protein
LPHSCWSTRQVYRRMKVQSRPWKQEQRRWRRLHFIFIQLKMLELSTMEYFSCSSSLKSVPNAVVIFCKMAGRNAVSWMQIQWTVLSIWCFSGPLVSEWLLELL